MGHIAKQSGALIARIRRIVGQLEAVERAILAEKDCTVTLHQTAAIRGAINGLMDELIEAYVREHVMNDDLTAAQRKEGGEDLIVALRRYAK